MSNEDLNDDYPPDVDTLEDGDPDITLVGVKVRQQALQRRLSGPPPLPAKAKKQRGAGTTRRIQAIEKRRLALELRKAGASYEAIAQKLGYADSTGARKTVLRAMSQLITEPAAEIKQMQIERLNHMLMSVWGMAQQGDLASINTALRIMQQLDQYTGAANAQQIDLNVNHTGGVLVVETNKEDYIRAMQQMAGVNLDGSNKALPPGPSDVVDVEVLDDPVMEALGETLMAEEVFGDELPVDVVLPDVTTEPKRGSTRRFDFGMDPERFAHGGQF